MVPAGSVTCLLLVGLSPAGFVEQATDAQKKTSKEVTIAKRLCMSTS
jgi:hypothetical protein